MRGFSIKDAPDVFKWCGSEECTKYLYWRPHIDIATTERVLSEWIRKRRNYSWAIEVDNKAVGEIQIIKELPNKGFLLGYILNRDYWGKGIATVAIETVLRFMFVQEGYLYSREWCDDRNDRSKRLLTKVGYEYVETKEGVFIAKKDETINEVHFILTKERYLKLQKEKTKQEGKQAIPFG